MSRPIPRNEEEAKHLVQDMFNNLDLGVVGERNDNGSDTITCPSCSVWGYIVGRAGGLEGICELKHKDNCNLVALYTWAYGEAP